MSRVKKSAHLRCGVLLLTFCLLGFSGESAVLNFHDGRVWGHMSDSRAEETIAELDHLGLLKKATKEDVKNLLAYQRQTGQSLAQVLQDPVWSRRFGLRLGRFKATWYMSNPFELLPEDLQQAIRKNKIPFKSRTHVWQWCRRHNVPRIWRKALYTALIETTPHNLWRASRGLKPFTKNGQFLEPLVIDHGHGYLEVRDGGHIATDPRIIPTNSVVYVLAKINGRDHILRVIATDVGGSIKGKHVDLSIQVSQGARRMPYTLLPTAIRNPTVTILSPLRSSNRGQKA